MRSSRQSSTSTLRTILLIAMITLVVAVLPARAQSAVPPATRQAGPVQAFAPPLTPQGTPRVGRKPPSLARTQTRRGWPLDNNVLYENGPVDGEDLGWTINFGFTVSDSMQATGPATGMQFWVWLIPGDTLTSAEVQIGAAPFGNELFDQTLNFTASNCFSNQFGYNICLESANFTGPTLSGTAWLTLSNASVPSGDPAYWDMNNGVGCASPGCPSQAQENTIGTVPSEAFTLLGTGTTTTTTGPTCFSEQPQDGFQVIHDFTGNGDGGGPDGVVGDRAGNIYGTTNAGGDYNAGMAFKVSQAGSGWLLNPLFSFPGGYNGQQPSPLLVGSDGALYGSAWGGLPNCGERGCGLVFRLRPEPTTCATTSCSWREDVLRRFSATDVIGGVSGFDQAGNLYGLSGDGAYGLGAVIELSPSAGRWIEKVLYNFPGGAEGGGPASLLVGNNGNLYGTTWQGGAYGYGVLFQLAPSDDGWTERVMTSFALPPGTGFWPELFVQDSLGDLFGVYYYTDWARGGHGTETDAIGFMFSPSNNSITQVFYLVPGGDYNDDVTIGGLEVDASGNLYGTAEAWYWDEGWPLFGEVFKVPPHGDGWQVQVLVRFADEYLPARGTLAVDARGDLYGTTSSCGLYNKGTVWQMSP